MRSDRDARMDRIEIRVDRQPCAQPRRRVSRGAWGCGQLKQAGVVCVDRAKGRTAQTRYRVLVMTWTAPIGR